MARRRNTRSRLLTRCRPENGCNFGREIRRHVSSPDAILFPAVLSSLLRLGRNH